MELPCDREPERACRSCQKSKVKCPLVRRTLVRPISTAPPSPTWPTAFSESRSPLIRTRAHWNSRSGPLRAMSSNPTSGVLRNVSEQLSRRIRRRPSWLEVPRSPTPERPAWQGPTDKLAFVGNRSAEEIRQPRRPAITWIRPLAPQPVGTPRVTRSATRAKSEASLRQPRMRTSGQSSGQDPGLAGAEAPIYDLRVDMDTVKARMATLEVEHTAWQREIESLRRLVVEQRSGSRPAGS